MSTEMVVSDPRLPIGGVKPSGYDREFGIDGVLEFTRAKTVWMGDEGDRNTDVTA